MWKGRNLIAKNYAMYESIKQSKQWTKKDYIIRRQSLSLKDWAMAIIKTLLTFETVTCIFMRNMLLRVFSLHFQSVNYIRTADYGIGTLIVVLVEWLKYFINL